jgi:lysozyme family protein
MKKDYMILIIIGIILTIIIFFRKKINKLFMFEILIPVILRHEGGYVNDPDDAGGETNFGITKARYPNLDIKNLTKKEAVEIYKRDFYFPMGIDKMSDVNLALQYFDMGVNAGIKNATKLMVQAQEIKQTSKVGAYHDMSLLNIYKDLRAQYYQEVSLRRNNKKYLAGWLNRIKSSVA